MRQKPGIWATWASLALMMIVYAVLVGIATWLILKVSL